MRFRARDRELVVQRLRQRNDRVFAGVIGAHVRCSNEPGNRRRVDDVAFVVLEHERHETADAVDHTPKVHAEGPFPGAERRLPAEAPTTNARVVAENMDAPERFHSRLGEGIHLALVGDIGGKSHCLDAFRRERFHRRVERGLFNVADRNFHACGTKATGHSEANPARTTSDCNNSTLKILHKPIFPRTPPTPQTPTPFRLSRSFSCGFRNSTPTKIPESIQPATVGTMTDVVPVGRVLGTEDSTPLDFWVAVAEDQYLQLDDVVVCERTVPGRDEIITIGGIVSEVRARHEGAQYDSDVFLIEDGVLPAQVSEAARVLATRVEPEVYVPPTPGAPVRRATNEERDVALYFDRMDRKIPIGLGRDGLPLYANLDFLDGTRGAHVNISGISGVATKTTYATFLLYALFNSPGLVAPHNCAALIFNVKGEDLLFLDHDNAKLDDTQREKYRKLGLMPAPFASVQVFAPARAKDSNGTPDVANRFHGVEAFWWTLYEFCQDELLPFVFADAEDERNQYTTVIHQVTRRLCDALLLDAESGSASMNGVSLRTLHDLVTFIEECVNSEDDQERRAWAGPNSQGTVNAFLRRLWSAVPKLERLIRSDVPLRDRQRAINTTGAQVTVVDIHNLPDRAQRFVVGVTLRRTFNTKEQQGTREPLLFVVLDELNKYAPREGTSPIKEILLDVAERGRSLGIVLIGAQQTASEVERRIVSNSALRVVGRLDAAEAGRPEYGFLPRSHQQRATIAKPGTMFVMQPEIPVPLTVEFPFPAWATRPDEVATGSPSANGTSLSTAASADVAVASPFDKFPS